MVLSLSVPSFSKSTTTSSSSAENHPPRHPSNPPSSSGPLAKLPWKTPSVLGSSGNNNPGGYGHQSSSSGSGTSLAEALRSGPLGVNITRSRSGTATAAAAGAGLSDTQREEQRREQEELNAALETLVRVFPDIRVEVFREMLMRFDGNSRLEVCVEQLLRHKEEWVAGRWNMPGDGDVPGASAGAGVVAPRLQGYNEEADAGEQEGNSLVPGEERFRTDEYKLAVRTVLVKEFTSLSKSAVDAVLAEVNFCYHRARPTLRDLSQKTWRATLNNLFPSFKRKKDRDRDDHPLLVWQQQRRATGDLSIPRLKETGCAELDRELHEALLAPLLRQRQEEQEGRDFRLAEELNESEAKAAEALYECECCLADVTFEQISPCSAASHIICYVCIQRTVHEALFGQGWSKSVDMERSTLKCLAPLAYGNCEGTLSPDIVKRAILLDKAGFETHCKFEDRLASETLFKSQFKLIRCPFCSYAEVDPVYHPSVRGVQWRFRQEGTLPTILMTLLLIDLICLFAIPATILWLQDSATIPAILHSSLLNLCLKIRPKRFTCSHPSCRRASCITCQKPWRDPHVCHEPLLLDLRATVEAARTAAVKRTCPRCGLSFIKSSGCNKLTCVCGYSMCYLCRKALGPPLEPALPQLRRRRPPPRQTGGFHNDESNGNAEDEDQEEEEPEDYRHFCEHFRVNPGSRCNECTKCDLYQAEDEDAIVRRAGERAEREWRARQGITGGIAPPGVGNRNINHDYSSVAASSIEGKRKGKGNAQQSWIWDMFMETGDTGPLICGATDSGNWRVRRWWIGWWNGWLLLRRFEFPVAYLSRSCKWRFFSFPSQVCFRGFVY